MSIENRVDEAIRESLEADPYAIAKQVVADVPDVEVAEAFTDAVAFMVKRRVQPTRILRRHEHGSRMAAPTSRMGKKLKRSIPKVGQLLATRQPVHGQYKFVGDMTRDDLLVVASFNRGQAAGNVRAAKQRERLADLLGPDQVVADLDDAVIEKAWWFE